MKYYHEHFNFMSVLLKHCLSLLTQYLRGDGVGGAETEWGGLCVKKKKPFQLHL